MKSSCCEKPISGLVLRNVQMPSLYHPVPDRWPGIQRAHRWLTKDEQWEISWVPVPECGCHIWTGHVDKDGYGELRVYGQTKKAHRYAWERKHGEIPDGMSVLHRCDVRPCVNDVHLFLGTQRDNMLDMIAKGRSKYTWNLLCRG